MSRLPTIDPADYTDDQRAVADAITAGPRGEVRGPFVPMMHNAKAADAVQRMGSFLRFDGSLPGRLRELAIIMTGRHWTAQYEWYAHYRIALEEGLDAAIADAVAERRRPDFKNTDEEIVYDFVSELYEKNAVSDATFTAAKDLLGPAGVVELVVLCGHYSVISLVLNTFDIQVPGGEKPLKD
ncbi:MAG: carboxymuconolactone decarboxylase family protein [Alphaproteobacteria bacterium]|nr:carboxymuconolactone decarboxylase family protein [Alphaproteobacteria bacterium]